MLIRASRGPPGGSSGASRGPPGKLPGACRGRPGGVLEKLHCALTKTHCSGPLRTPPGPSGRPPRGSRLPPGGPLEAAWAPLGRPRGPPGGYLERFQIVFNRLQAVLGRLEAPLALQCRQSTKVAYVCHFRPFPRPPGRLPGASRGPPGGLPGASGGLPAAIFRPPDPSRRAAKLPGPSALQQRQVSSASGAESGGKREKTSGSWGRRKVTTVGASQTSCLEETAHFRPKTALPRESG